MKKTFLSKLDETRIKLHLIRMSYYLKNRPILTNQKKRERCIFLLDKYIKDSKFPKNIEHKNMFVPQIRDAFGTPCAMAYIIENTGSKKLVDELEKKDNLIYINSVKEGPLTNWIGKNGITQKEAAMVQPTYGWQNPTSTIMPYGDFYFIICSIAIILILLGLEYSTYKFKKNLFIPSLSIKEKVILFLKIQLKPISLTVLYSTIFIISTLFISWVVY